MPDSPNATPSAITTINSVATNCQKNVPKNDHRKIIPVRIRIIQVKFLRINFAM
jgi:hypothetical protein